MNSNNMRCVLGRVLAICLAGCSAPATLPVATPTATARISPSPDTQAATAPANPGPRATQRAEQTLTAAAAYTGISAVNTRLARTPSRTPAPTATRDQSTVTPKLTPWPTPDWLTPVSLVLTVSPEGDRDALVAQILRQFVRPSFVEKSFFSIEKGNTFGVIVQPGVVDQKWKEGETMVDPNGLYRVFMSYGPDPTSNPVATQTVEEYYQSLLARKMFLEEIASGETYLIDMKGTEATRPIELDGWLNDDVFIFSHCGNPSQCFVTAVDVKEKVFVLTLVVEDIP